MLILMFNTLIFPDGCKDIVNQFFLSAICSNFTFCQPRIFYPTGASLFCDSPKVLYIYYCHLVLSFYVTLTPRSEKGLSDPNLHFKIASSLMLTLFGVCIALIALHPYVT